MGQLHNGILGPSTGRIGTVTCYQRNGKNIIRIARNNGIVKPTQARLAQREKIRVCSAFTQAFTGTGFFNISFPAYGHSGTGYNRAMGQLMNLAIKGHYPGQELSYENIRIARGPLPPALDATATLDGDSKIKFTWTDNSGEGTARPGDKAILVAYAIEIKQVVFSLDNGERATGEAVLNAGIFASYTIATWISFLNASGDVADSVFAGMIY